VFLLTSFGETPAPPETTARATAIAWGDRVFTDQARLEDWLQTRGATYKRWARNHPRAAPWQPPPKARVAEESSDDGESATAAASKRVDELVDAFADFRAMLFLALVLALAMLLVAASAVPPPWYRGRVQGASVLLHRRVEAAALGIGLLAGLGLPALFP
jgi:hypothetical protein